MARADEGAALAATTAPSRTRACRAGMRDPYQDLRRPTTTSIRIAGSSRYRLGPSRTRTSTRRTVAGVYELTGYLRYSAAMVTDSQLADLRAALATAQPDYMADLER